MKNKQEHSVQNTEPFPLKVSTPMRVTFLIITLLFFQSCFTADRTKDGKTLEEQSLDEFGISIYYPEDWEIVDDDYFDFKAIGLGPNNLPAIIEYRGLANDGRDRSRMDQYATGWFLGISKSYPEWEYIQKDNEEVESGRLYSFEGKFRVATDVYRKIGMLRFTEKRIHAIYFTARDIDFDKVRPYFLEIFNKTEFFTPDGEIPEKRPLSEENRHTGGG